MEVEKRKKKRITREEDEEESEKMKKLMKEEEEGASGVPTEEEVEEFFAILRRMKVAVKYFDERGRGRKEWRQELEKAELTVDDGGKVAGEVGGVVDNKNMSKKGRREVTNKGFDLNTLAPEAAESGGA